MGNRPLLTKVFSGSLRAWAGCRKDYRTKLSLRIASVLLLFMAMLPYTAGAFNNHLTDANYYDAALRGRDKIHFKVPIFQEDRGGADLNAGNYIPSISTISAEVTTIGLRGKCLRLPLTTKAPSFDMATS